MGSEEPRNQAARAAAEAALVRVVHHYGSKPEFVLIGGLVPELLCTTTAINHAGTTDIDVQIDLEIATGSVNAARLEQALRNAEFEPDSNQIWCWYTHSSSQPAIIKFELLADLVDEPANITLNFDDCDMLGAANVRGTGFATSDTAVHPLSAVVGGVWRNVEVNVTGLAGFLLTKTAAAYSRRQPKDWYDIAYVLLNNDHGGPAAAAEEVRSRFSADLDPIEPMLQDLGANFADPHAQGPMAYSSQLALDHPDVPADTACADAVIAMETFLKKLR